MLTRTRHSRRPLRLGLSALLLGVLVVLVPVAPAQAHDRLVSSDPESGATLEEAPEEIELTFSAAVQDIGGSVDLVDGDGGAVEVGSPSTEGSTVTTSVDEELPAGDYEVRWRVVSSDGHAISGVVEFSVEGQEGAATDSSSTTSSPAPSESTAASPTDSSGAEAPEEDAESSPVLLLLAGVAAVAIVLGAVFGLLRARRRSDD